MVIKCDFVLNLHVKLKFATNNFWIILIHQGSELCFCCTRIATILFKPNHGYYIFENVWFPCVIWKCYKIFLLNFSLSKGVLLLHIVWFSLIRQWSDYVIGVKDRSWASNWIMLEFDWTVHNSEWRWNLVCFPTFFQLLDKCHNIVLHFRKIYSLK